MTPEVEVTAAYERAVSRLCARLGAPEGYREDVTARSMPIEEIAAELLELAERRERRA